MVNGKYAVLILSAAMAHFTQHRGVVRRHDDFFISAAAGWVAVSACRQADAIFGSARIMAALFWGAEAAPRPRAHALAAITCRQEISRLMARMRRRAHAEAKSRASAGGMISRFAYGAAGAASKCQAAHQNIAAQAVEYRVPHEGLSGEKLHRRVIGEHGIVSFSAARCRCQ